MPGIGNSRVIVGSANAASANVLPSTSKFPYLHRALSRVQAGTGDSKIGFIGESTTYGYSDFCGYGPLLSVSKYLTAAALPAKVGMTIANNPGSLGTDTRFSVGAGWSRSFIAHWAWAGVNPGYIGANGAAPNTLKFTPNDGIVIDSYDVYTIQSPGFGTIQVNVGGGSNTGIVGAGAASIAKHTVAGAALANQTLQAGTVTVANAEIVGIEPFNSTTHYVRLGNMGVSSTTTTEWLDEGTPGIGSLDCIKAYAADVWVIVLGTNDLLNAIPTATTLANLSTIIAACQTTPCDIFIASPIPSAPSFTWQPGEAPLTVAFKQFAATNGYGFIDFFNGWGGLGGYTELNPLGYYFDTLHPTGAFGYEDMGRIIAQALLAA